MKFSPGDFLCEELKARKWTQGDLAYLTGLPLHDVKEILSGKKPITATIAQSIGDVLGTSAELWLNLERSYRDSKTATAQAAEEDGGRTSATGQ